MYIGGDYLDKMQQCRKQKGLTREKLAGLVDVSTSMIVKIEAGERKPSVKLAKRIASVLGFPWTDFFPESA